MIRRDSLLGNGGATRRTTLLPMMAVSPSLLDMITVLVVLLSLQQVVGQSRGEAASRVSLMPAPTSSPAFMGASSKCSRGDEDKDKRRIKQSAEIKWESPAAGFSTLSKEKEMEYATCLCLLGLLNFAYYISTERPPLISRPHRIS
ncbi:uncharacterized protein LOC113764179 [Coffea eugenioides]|uniref:uncharacterized protein LOC113764179 n=1 Tax=Coffea eugenioides TaxID=49369 RepID=UPI000F6064DE|nr:uncharacterized protein LOC113764179 [Coffea eugenioides]